MCLFSLEQSEKYTVLALLIKFLMNGPGHVCLSFRKRAECGFQVLYVSVPARRVFFVAPPKHLVTSAVSHFTEEKTGSSEGSVISFHLKYRKSPTFSSILQRSRVDWQRAEGREGPGRDRARRRGLERKAILLSCFPPPPPGTRGY